MKQYECDLCGYVYDIRALFQLRTDLCGFLGIQLLFILELVIQTRPEIHGDRADLDFHTDIFLTA